jgi:uncharacterized membrane protein
MADGGAPVTGETSGTDSTGSDSTATDSATGHVETIAENLLTPTEWAHLSKRDQRLMRAMLARIVERSAIGQASADELMAARTLGERVADRVAGFGGSWTFILLFIGFLAAWALVNTVVLVTRAFDPYPFIFLNLLLSMLAALQAPVIMLSQNRQAQRDRLAAQNDYEVNLKAEAEIRELHEKLDALRAAQWSQLIAQQEEQIKLLSYLCGPEAKRSAE